MSLILRLLLILLVTAGAVLLLPRLVTAAFAWQRVFTASQVPPAPVAIVFGAGLSYAGKPSPVLRDRVETAAELYFAGKVQKLLLSGDNRTLDYNEPGAMHDYAIILGVPEESMVLDYAGRRTYDTCYRARVIFQVERAILVTQSFHLPRALYLCNALGVPATGVAADLREYRKSSQLYWQARETPATLVALYELYVSRPLPVLGDPEPIFPSKAGITE